MRIEGINVEKRFRAVIDNSDNPASVASDWSEPVFKYVKTSKSENAETAEYVSECGGISVYTETEHIGGVTRQCNRIKNNTGHSIDVNRISSAYFGDLFPNCLADDRIILHYCVNSWQGEGRWKHVTLTEFGLEDVTHHDANRTSCSISSIGSWSTARYYPLVIIEDTKSGETYFFEHEGGFSWEIEFNLTGHAAGCCLCVDINSANENQNGFCAELKDDGEYRTSYVLSGKADGGFEAAVQLLTEYKQRNINTLLELPVCFNDFMNCLWAKPNIDDEISLIDAAAAAGAEIYCIDDGWFLQRGGIGFGDWAEDDSLFGDMGFSGLVKYISQKGMKPGIWLELETCMPNSKIYEISGNCLLKRHGKVIGKNRSFLNMSDKAVHEKLFSVIAHLYELGIRYIKNDYNHSMGIGCENYGGSYAEGLIKNMYAFYSFIDEVKEKFPELIIENCGSGAMRCDSGTLSHFNLQSISDQEDYINNPAIIQGISACIPPEKCGIWVLPYPVSYGEQGISKEEYDEKYGGIMDDGNQTVYNMCCGMFGVMMLSGRIDFCDEYNAELIKKGVAAYKKIRKVIKGGVPIYPKPQERFYKNGCSCIGLLNKTEKKIIIGIFKNDKRNDYSIDLSKWVDSDAKTETVYCGNNITVSMNNCIMEIKTTGNIAAGVFMLDL